MKIFRTFPSAVQLCEICITGSADPSNFLSILKFPFLSELTLTNVLFPKTNETIKAKLKLSSYTH